MELLFIAAIIQNAALPFLLKERNTKSNQCLQCRNLVHDLVYRTNHIGLMLSRVTTTFLKHRKW
nr:MAG TPA: hypothetical protein [Caudoviricetes sp.]